MKIIDETASFGNNVDIQILGTLQIGKYSHIGDNCRIRGNNISIGNHFYNSKDLNIGGGGNTNPTANLIIGDRCVIHNTFINLSSEVIIGNDVGFSYNVSLVTHGYWLSVLDGYPAKFDKILIGNGVIVGYGTIILMGVSIADNIVIGAGSVVTKSLTKEKSIYAGNPAKFIRTIEEPSFADKKENLTKIINNYNDIKKFHGILSNIKVTYPEILVDNCCFNVETMSFTGEESENTDHFRDYARKYGLRFYSSRPFKTIIHNDLS